MESCRPYMIIKIPLFHLSLFPPLQPILRQNDNFFLFSVKKSGFIKQVWINLLINRYFFPHG